MFKGKIVRLFQCRIEAYFNGPVNFMMIILHRFKLPAISRCWKL